MDHSIVIDYEVTDYISAGDSVLKTKRLRRDRGEGGSLHFSVSW